MKTIYSILIWIYWAICLCFFFVIIALLYLITFLFDRHNRLPNKVVSGLAWCMLKLNPGWSFSIKGADPGKIAQPTIVVANHQSFLDLPLLYLLPWTMKWVAKKSLFKIPVLGWIIYMTGQIAIERHSMRSAHTIDKLVDPIKHGVPGMMFPEGTRTTTGDLKRFKKGAFMLAQRYNFNILPVVVDGGYQAMPPGSWRTAYRQHFEISVLEPISPQQYKSERELKETAYLLIKEELASLRQSTE